MKMGNTILLLQIWPYFFLSSNYHAARCTRSKESTICITSILAKMITSIAKPNYKPITKSAKRSHTPVDTAS